MFIRTTTAADRKEHIRYKKESNLVVAVGVGARAEASWKSLEQRPGRTRRWEEIWGEVRVGAEERVCEAKRGK